MAMDEEQEQQELAALFHPSSPSTCGAAYYVQSPSAASHTLSQPSDDARSSNDVATRLTLSRYSSSRGSSHCFLHDVKRSDVDGEGGGRILPSSADAAVRGSKRQVLRIVSGRATAVDGDERTAFKGAWSFLAVDADAPCCCVVYQVAWRVALSLALAMAIFFVATKPDPPNFSLSIGRTEWFSLGEGLDGTGVETTVLDFNCSMIVGVDNYSKIFGLHVHPLTVEMAFADLSFASTQGVEAYVESASSSSSTIYVAAKNRPVYAAGRSMQDMIESGEGAPVVLRARSRSVYRVVLRLVELEFDHRAECFLSIVRMADGTARFLNSTCSVAILRS